MLFAAYDERENLVGWTAVKLRAQAAVKSVSVNVARHRNSRSVTPVGLARIAAALNRFCRNLIAFEGQDFA